MPDQITRPLRLLYVLPAELFGGAERQDGRGGDERVAGTMRRRRRRARFLPI